ncbi:MAG TPA: DUF937 domain-containing protein [Ignavibacteria bacterium]|nr:hypothetical protein [Bacteroidota bacterium]HRI85528.1 DUF937 domain-containing protein [Ignavibacteria bacterium]HRJ98172.1 DUF937 domain-containing protein [Ignavibacteria bacterium]
MTDILNGLLGSLTGNETPEKIGSALNIDPNIIKQAIPVLAPMILGGLKRQSETMGGQERVDHILNKYGDPGVLENVDSLIEEKSRQESFDTNLGGLLGNSGSQVTDMLTKNFNLDGSTAAKLIPMVAPLILGYLTKSRDTSGEGSAGFASFLDQNGDGSIIDDVAGFFTNKQQSNDGSGGGLMDILGGLLGKK